MDRNAGMPCELARGQRPRRGTVTNSLMTAFNLVPDAVTTEHKRPPDKADLFARKNPRCAGPNCLASRAAIPSLPPQLPIRTLARRRSLRGFSGGKVLSLIVLHVMLMVCSRLMLWMNCMRAVPPA